MKKHQNNPCKNIHDTHSFSQMSLLMIIKQDVRRITAWHVSLSHAYLRFRQMQLFRYFSSLRRAEVFVFAEGFLQVRDLLGAELGSDAAVRPGFSFTVFPHIALRGRSVPTAIWWDGENLLDAFQKPEKRDENYLLTFRGRRGLALYFSKQTERFCSTWFARIILPQMLSMETLGQPLHGELLGHDVNKRVPPVTGRTLWRRRSAHLHE